MQTQFTYAKLLFLQEFIDLIQLAQHMFSNIKASESTQIINFDYLSKLMKTQGIELNKQKKNEIESGLSVSSFLAKKNGVILNIFIMCLSANNIICSGYHKDKLIGERQAKGQYQLPEIIYKMFNGLKNNLYGKESDKTLGAHIEKLRVIALNKESDYHDYLGYSQDLKFSPQYLEYVKYQKLSLEKIVQDSQKIIKDMNQIRIKNESLIEPLLQIQVNKQNLESIILAFEDQKHVSLSITKFLSNPKQRFSEQISQKKQIAEELTQFFQDQEVFNNFINNLTQIKRLEIMIKALAL